MELSGIIKAALPPASGVSAKTGNAWMKQEYVIETVGDHPKRMAFTVFGEDKIKQFNLTVGTNYNIQFDIDAHEYQGRWYNDIRAYNATQLPQPVQKPAPIFTGGAVPYGETPPETVAPNDLPF